MSAQKNVNKWTFWVGEKDGEERIFKKKKHLKKLGYTIKKKYFIKRIPVKKVQLKLVDKTFIEPIKIDPPKFELKIEPFTIITTNNPL